MASAIAAEFPTIKMTPGSRSLARISSGLRYPSRSVQLEQVGSCADQFPLAAHLVQAAQAEAPEAAPLLDLPEDRLDDGLAHLVHRPPRLGAQLVAHGFLRRGSLPRRPAGCSDNFFVLIPACGDVQIDPCHALIRNIGFAEVTGIG